MANIEIVIKIREEAYQGIVNVNKAHDQWGNDLLGILCAGITNGTQLPKGHGRLIDGDKIKTAFPSGEYVRTESVRATIDHEDTIIEADKSESEEV